MLNDNEPRDGEPVPACPNCLDPLSDDGSCASCGTTQCECGAIVPASEMTPLTDQGVTLPACRECVASFEGEDGVPVEVVEGETVEVRTPSDAELVAEIEMRRAS